MMKEKEQKKKSPYWKILISLVAVTVLLNVLGCFQGFCDWYKLTVYGVISDALGVAMGWFPFALGEILGYLGILLVIAGIIFLILLPFLRKKAGYRRFLAGYGKGTLMLVVAILFVYTCNWILPFRGTILEIKGATERKYSLKEVQNVRNHLVEELNRCALEVARDYDGNVIYDRKVLAEGVFAAMKAQAKDYPLLSGYYPPMKAALCSDFLEWMNIGGYTYPYTMEVTWNVYCTDLFYPFLLAHESSHHQGYYQENEANFIAFLACTQSEDPLVRYAGYLEIYYYVNGAYVGSLFQDMDRLEALAIFEQQPKLSEKVLKDEAYAREKSEEKYEAVSHPAEKLQETSAKVADVGWSVQGDLLRENSYDGVVKMVLQYYDVKEGGLDSPF